jgi:hypothetical protein
MEEECFGGAGCVSVEREIHPQGMDEIPIVLGVMGEEGRQETPGALFARVGDERVEKTLVRSPIAAQPSGSPYQASALL